MRILDTVADPRQREPLELLVEAEDARELGEPYPLYTVGGGMLWTAEVVTYDPARSACPHCGTTLPDFGALCLVCSQTRLVPIQRPMQPRRKFRGPRRHSPGSLKGGKS